MQQACLSLWQTEMVVNILHLKCVEWYDSKHYLTQFSRLLCISRLWIRLHKKGFCCVRLTIAWIFLTKYLSFLSSNHNVLMFLQVESKFSDFFERLRNIHIIYTRIFVSLFCLVLLGSSIWHDMISITTCRAFSIIDSGLWFQIIISRFRLIRTHRFYVKYIIQLQ
jgi:hypothetical protein